ncbi:hypothetical protein HTZ77_38280 [Nonomuraea sp. SMC257]|uniref:Uncharacterized protein n=1 Tax=Nonomuraea montanisoli TaxID=2741721 RepID=A0A7Y6IFB3_9ACTN|nr:hypothetical protein [Nonomuraea montanisoli]NUW37212.1 hypothetical protein [Nonomuraea montanisoli]
MSNGVRHVLGVVAGIILPPLIAVMLMYGVTEVNLSFHNFVVSWTGLALVVLAGALLAVLAASRVSPVASLLGGIGFTLLGVLPFIEIMSGPIVPDRLMSGWLRNGYLTLGLTGTFLLLGIVLLVSSAFPSRWRGSRPVVVTPGYVSQGQVSQGQVSREYGAPQYGPPQYGTSQGHGGSPSYGSPPSYGQVPDDTTRPMHRE